ncbi:hypothetical protein ACPOLB_02795 [Rubrivivax sp. RP6-9]
MPRPTPDTATTPWRWAAPPWPPLPSQGDGTAPALNGTEASSAACAAPAR